MEEAHRYFKSDQYYMVMVDGKGGEGDIRVVGYDAWGEKVAGFLNWDISQQAFRRTIEDHFEKRHDGLKDGDTILAYKVSENPGGEIKFFAVAPDLVDLGETNKGPEGISLNGNVYTQIVEPGTVDLGGGRMNEERGLINAYAMCADENKNPDNAVSRVRRDGPSEYNDRGMVIINDGARLGLVGKIASYCYIQEDLYPDSNIMFVTPMNLG